MTEWEWRQLPQLKREVELLQRQVRRLEAAQKQADERRQRGQGEAGDEEIASQLAALVQQLREAAAIYLERVEAGYAFLGEVPDSQMRQILNLRYLEGMSWQRVAFAIGEYDEQYPRKKCRRFWMKEAG